MFSHILNNLLYLDFDNALINRYNLCLHNQRQDLILYFSIYTKSILIMVHIFVMLISISAV